MLDTQVSQVRLGLRWLCLDVKSPDPAVKLVHTLTYMGNIYTIMYTTILYILSEMYFLDMCHYCNMYTTILYY